MYNLERMSALRRRVSSILLCGLVGCAVPEAGVRPPRELLPGAPLFQRPGVWTDDQGASVTLSRWSGSTVVLGAFYASCGKTCPLTIEKLRQVDAAYRAAGRAAEFVLVTIDPGSDSPEVLRRYKEEHRLPASWHLLRGTPAQTEEVTDLLDIHVVDLGPHVVHGSRIMVFDPAGATARSFRCCDFDPAWTVQ